MCADCQRIRWLIPAQFGFGELRHDEAKQENQVQFLKGVFSTSGEWLWAVSQLSDLLGPQLILPSVLRNVIPVPPSSLLVSGEVTIDRGSDKTLSLFDIHNVAPSFLFSPSPSNPMGRFMRPRTDFPQSSVRNKGHSKVMPYNSAHHCVVEVENFLFVLGGEDQWNPNGKHSTNFVSRYDPRFNSWIQLPPMQERRASFYACRLDKNLYVIGGRNETGYLSSVECYNLETNEWRGVHNGEYVPWLYCYDPVMDVWARKQDMNTKRAIHTLAVMNDRLYAIGGNHLKGFSHLDVMLVECYDPKGDQWNILQTPILEGRSGPGCAVLDDSIYLVGGYSWSMGAYKSSTICYSPEKGTWTELEGDVAEPLAGPACSTVILPACVPYNK
ncbi:hypothetical protein Q9966_010114 [Columba livia]|nr:hypothetical protein Q9966_010114 [Columba livia]